MDELIEFIYQLSVEDAEVAVGTLKELIYFIKRGREKQLIFPVIVIRLDNNSQTDIRAIIDNECTRSCINQQFVINYKIPTKQIPLTIPVYNTDSILNKNRSIKKFAILQLAINDHYECIDLTITELDNMDLFLGYDWLKIHNPLIDQINMILSFNCCSKTCGY